jgi:hypothetical protein
VGMRQSTKEDKEVYENIKENEYWKEGRKRQINK